MSRKDEELKRLIQNIGRKKVVENLAYWKARLRVASRQYNRKPCKSKAETLAMCDRMVRKIEKTVLR